MVLTVFNQEVSYWKRYLGLENTCSAYDIESPTRPPAMLSLLITANKAAKKIKQFPINSKRRESHLWVTKITLHLLIYYKKIWGQRKTSKRHRKLKVRTLKPGHLGEDCPITITRFNCATSEITV